MASIDIPFRNFWTKSAMASSNSVSVATTRTSPQPAHDKCAQLPQNIQLPRLRNEWAYIVPEGAAGTQLAPRTRAARALQPSPRGGVSSAALPLKIARSRSPSAGIRSPAHRRTRIGGNAPPSAEPLLIRGAHPLYATTVPSPPSYAHASLAPLGES